jgi:hypothetical protein
MFAFQRSQHGIIERLNSQAQAIYPVGFKDIQAIIAQPVRISFNRKFSVVTEFKMTADQLKERLQIFGRKMSRSAATNKQRGDSVRGPAFPDTAGSSDPDWPPA